MGAKLVESLIQSRGSVGDVLWVCLLLDGELCLGLSQRGRSSKRKSCQGRGQGKLHDGGHLVLGE